MHVHVYGSKQGSVCFKGQGYSSERDWQTTGRGPRAVDAGMKEAARRHGCKTEQPLTAFLLLCGADATDGPLFKAVEQRDKDMLTVCLLLCRADATDGPLFKAVEQRDKDKEIQRLQRELAEAQHNAGVAGKEAKKAKQQVARMQEQVGAVGRGERGGRGLQAEPLLDILRY